MQKKTNKNVVKMYANVTQISEVQKQNNFVFTNTIISAYINTHATSRVKFVKRVVPK